MAASGINPLGVGLSVGVGISVAVGNGVSVGREVAVGADVGVRVTVGDGSIVEEVGSAAGAALQAVSTTIINKEKIRFINSSHLLCTIFQSKFHVKNILMVFMAFI